MSGLENEISLLHHLAKHGYISRCFDTAQWKLGAIYSIRVSHVFDPSKMWIVLLERELAYFHECVKMVFKQQGFRYKMPAEVVQKNMYCVVSADGAYYRGTIVNIMSTTDGPKAVVFGFDFGFHFCVTFDKLFYLPAKFYLPPQFAIRASLIGIMPKDEDSWKYNIVNRVHELVNGKRVLCLLYHVDMTYKILHISLGSVEEGALGVRDVAGTLLQENLVKPFGSLTEKRPESGLVPKVLFPWFYPTFDEIERGAMPNNVYIWELLKKHRSPLLNHYYEYKPAKTKNDPEKE